MSAFDHQAIRAHRWIRVLRAGEIAVCGLILDQEIPTFRSPRVPKDQNGSPAQNTLLSNLPTRQGRFTFERGYCCSEVKEPASSPPQYDLWGICLSRWMECDLLLPSNQHLEITPPATQFKLPRGVFLVRCCRWANGFTVLAGSTKQTELLPVRIAGLLASSFEGIGIPVVPLSSVLRITHNRSDGKSVSKHEASNGAYPGTAIGEKRNHTANTAVSFPKI